MGVPTGVNRVTTGTKVLQTFSSTCVVNCGGNLVTGGRVIVAVSNNDTTDATYTVIDAAGNTYTEQITNLLTGIERASLFSAPVTAGIGTNPNITVTASNSSGSILAVAMQYTGLDPTSGAGAVDVTAAGGTFGTTTSASTGASAATHIAHELVIALYANSGWSDTSITPTGPTGASQIVYTGSSVFAELELSEADSGATGTQTAMWTSSGSDQYAAVLAVFRVPLVIADTGAGVEASPALSITVADSGTGTETTPSPITKTDPGVGGDVLSVLAPVPISDSGTGVERAPLIAFAEADSGTGADIPTTGNIGGVGPTGVTTVSQSDAGSGVDIVAQVGAQPASVLVDDFNAAARNTVLWNAQGDTAQGFGTGLSGRLRLHAVPTESLYRSVFIYSIEGSTVQARFVTPPTAADAIAGLRVTDGVNVARIAWNAGTTPTLTADWYNGTSWATLTSVTYDPVAHAFWRLRADGTPTIYHETAPTAAGPWTTIHSGPLGWAPTAITVILGTATVSTVDGGWAEFDDVNIVGQSSLDTGTGTDTALQGPSDIDTGIGAETVLAISVAVNAIDSGVGAELTPTPTFIAVDPCAGADLASVAAAVQIADTGTGTDLIPGAAFTVPADTAVGTSTATNSFAVTDPGFGIDTAVPSVLANGVDVGGGVELTTAITVRVADTGAGAETLTNTSPFATDTAAGTDRPTIGFSEADTGAGADSALLAVTVTVAEAGVGGDQLAVNATQPTPDTGTGADLPLTPTFTVPGDSGTGVDGLTVRVLVVDLGAGVELLVIRTTLIDVGAGGDAQTVFAGFSVTQTDTAAGADLLALVKLLADTGTSGDGTTGPGSVITSFARSYVRSAAGRTFAETTVC